MNRIASFVVPAFLAFAAPAQAATETYAFDPMHASVTWFINHFGFSNPSGKFTAVQGTLTLDDAHPENSKVAVTITIGNLVTGIDKLDAHLKSADFFNADQFPTASFTSDKVERTGDKTAKVSGMLTLHGVTKPVTLEVTLNNIGESPITKKKTAGFSATAMLKRSDFGIDKYLPGLGDDVKLIIETEAALQP
ncbi:MAG: YceI family protein [Pseudomonadota bacterium]|nr:YceI family protein [Pseudomonadota bacterium]